MEHYRILLPAQFVIQPNSSLNRQHQPILYLLLAVICLGIALRLASLGYWMILPFAVLDMATVGLILYLITRKSAYREKVIIDGDHVVIRHVEKNNRKTWRFPVHWTQIRLDPPIYRWYLPRLLLGSKGKWVEIGRCLNQEERESLAKAMQAEIGRQTLKIIG
ncbi:MAG: DUF2244 domain-containing protein [Gammaproteobacteria bacterium]|nr:DUF2244 domain-containing protein [Gammaproteobacteria bacterium]MCY4218379.1 DUF2244 domain-containing protein [Gammaproteobacteria bacterium]MCY4273986.1 DUF2244 domain-containing protein [Gammaproteobacteria bacterium]